MWSVTESLMPSFAESFTCLVCCARFKSAHTLQTHTKRVHASPEQRVTCQQCERIFANKHYLYAHTLNKHRAEQSRARCDLCVRDFRTMRALQMHKNKEHPGQTDWDCGTCGLRLPSEGELRAHADAAHPAPAGAYPCKQCDKTYTSLVNLESHMRAAHSERRHSCAHCPLTFRNGHHLRRHVSNIHERVAHTCTVCSRAFPSALYLKEHSVLHSEEGKVECERCHKTFHGRARLNKHIKVVHSAAETGTKHACSVCSMEFGCATYLARHYGTVHAPAGPMLPCVRCGKSFKSQRYLQNHMRRHEERDRKRKDKVTKPTKPSSKRKRRKPRATRVAPTEHVTSDEDTDKTSRERAETTEIAFIKCEPIDYRLTPSPTSDVEISSQLEEDVV